MSDRPATSPRNVTELMPALAAEFVEACKAAGVSLDYLPRTLPFADKFAKGAPAEAGRMAAYLGEVVRRETKGLWFESDGTAFVDAGLDHHVDPAAVTRGILEHGRAAADGTIVESSKAYCELITRQQRQWLDRAVLGNYESMAALRTSMSTDAKTAGILLGLAQGAVLLAKLDWNEALDSTADSLDAVERILGAMHGFASKPVPEVSEEQITALGQNMGVYIGEIIRRHYGGQWQMAAEGSLELIIGNIPFHPIAKARKRIVDGAAENVRMYFNSMQKALSS